MRKENAKMDEKSMKNQLNELLDQMDISIADRWKGYDEVLDRYIYYWTFEGYEGYTYWIKCDGETFVLSKEAEELLYFGNSIEELKEEIEEIL